MNEFMYSEWFEAAKAEAAYESDEECLNEWLLLLDLCLKLAFLVRRDREKGTGNVKMKGLPVQPDEIPAVLRYRGKKEPDRYIGSGLAEQYECMIRHLRSRMVSSQIHSGDRTKIGLQYLQQQYELDFAGLFILVCAAAPELDRNYLSCYQALLLNQEAGAATAGLISSLYELIFPEAGEDISCLLEPESMFALRFLVRSGHEADRLRHDRLVRVRKPVLELMEKGGSARRMASLQRYDTDIPGTSYIPAVYSRSDLVVSAQCSHILELLCDQIRYQEKVLDEWGFRQKMAYGRGVSALFYGPPGTGKTMAAQVVAAELGMELYRVDISRLVSKYIGETEKNISLVFEKAARRNVILFFDEADALFGRRTEIRSSHDRNANMETAHLLQCMETYEGMVILATNYRNNVDEAFRRRIRFYAAFEMPGPDERRKLWKQMLDGAVPEEFSADLETLSKRHELSGSNIREIVVNAAYIAAARNEKIREQDLQQSLQLYYEKQGRTLHGERFWEQER